MPDNPVFDERIGIGNVHKVTLEQIARLEEGVSGLNCTFVDGKVITFHSILASTILDDGRFLIRTWISEVYYVPVDKHQNYIVVKSSDGDVLYTSDVSGVGPDDRIIPVINVPSNEIEVIRKRLKEEK